MQFGTARVDLHSGEVLRDGATQQLTAKERELLLYLIERPHQDLSRSVIQTELWGYHPNSSSRAIDTVVKRLRANIEPPGAPRFLATVRGVGYRFEPPPAPRTSHIVAPWTRFFGRKAELKRLSEQRLSGTRAVLITGPPGVGKTRLALEFAKAQQPQGTVKVVDLLGSTTVRGMTTQLAAVLGADLVHAGTAREEASRVHAALRDSGELLLILDNLEQVQPAPGAMLTDLFDNCPQLTLIYTSQRAIDVPGLSTLRLAGLPPTDAAEMFIDRATAAIGEPISPQKHRDIADIISLLNGLPLALELAAGRLASTDVPTLHHQLRGGVLSLLTSEETARHASLKNALDWSWRLLQPPDRTALTQISVLRGYFSEQAAAAVLGERATHVIHALVRQSWLTVRRHPQLAYSLCAGGEEFVSAIATDSQVRLEARGNAARWFCSLGAPATLRAYRSHGGIRIGRQLEFARENLGASVDYVIEHSDGQDLVHGTLALVASLRRAGALTQARQALERALAAQTIGPSATFALTRELVELALRQRPPDQALLDSQTELARHLPAPASAWALKDRIEWGIFYEVEPHSSDLDTLERAFEGANSLDGLAAAAVMRFRVACRFGTGPADEAFAAALHKVHAAQDIWYEADICGWYGIRLAVNGRNAEAKGIFAKCVALQRSQGELGGSVISGAARAYAAWGAGDLDRALTLNRAAVEHAATQQIYTLVAFLLTGQALLLEEMGQFEEMLDVAQRVALIIGPSDPSRRANVLIATALWRLGDNQGAAAQLQPVPDTGLWGQDKSRLLAAIAEPRNTTPALPAGPAT